MSYDPFESIERWRSITRDQFGATANLILGLAAGLLAFLASLLLDAKFKVSCAHISALGAIAILAGSVGFAVCCAVNRLRDFRLTAAIAREDIVGTPSEAKLESMRVEARRLGDASWRFFWWQLGSFALGALLASVAVLAQAWHQ